MSKNKHTSVNKISFLHWKSDLPTPLHESAQININGKTGNCGLFFEKVYPSPNCVSPCNYRTGTILYRDVLYLSISANLG